MSFNGGTGVTQMGLSSWKGKLGKVASKSPSGAARVQVNRMGKQVRKAYGSARLVGSLETGPGDSCAGSVKGRCSPKILQAEDWL